MVSADTMQSDPLIVENAGDYEWSIAEVKLPVTSTTTNPVYGGGSEIKGQYEVFRVQSIFLELVELSEKEMDLHGDLLIQQLSVQPVYVEAIIYNEDSEHFEESPFDNPDQAIAARLKHLKSGHESDPVLLLQDEENPAFFSGYVGGDMADRGNYQLVVQIIGAYDMEKYRLEKPEDGTDSTKIARKDPILNDPRFYGGIVGTTALLILAFSGFKISKFINPLRGELVFQYKYATIPLYSIDLHRGRQNKREWKRLGILKMSPILMGIRSLKITHDRGRPGAILVEMQPSSGDGQIEHSFADEQKRDLDGNIRMQYFRSGREG